MKCISIDWFPYMNCNSLKSLKLLRFNIFVQFWESMLTAGMSNRPRNYTTLLCFSQLEMWQLLKRIDLEQQPNPWRELQIYKMSFNLAPLRLLPRNTRTVELICSISYIAHLSWAHKHYSNWRLFISSFKPKNKSLKGSLHLNYI